MKLDLPDIVAGCVIPHSVEKSIADEEKQQERDRRQSRKTNISLLLSGIAILVSIISLIRDVLC